MITRRLAALLPILLGCSRVTGAETAQLSADTSLLDFGTVDPASAAAVLPGRVNLVVSSGAPWQVTAAVSPDDVPNRPTVRFSWRVPGDRFHDLAPLVPTPLAAGAATSAAQAQVTFEVRPVVGWETPPGRYAARLQLFLNGTVSASLRVTLVVAARVDLVVDAPKMESPAVDPTQQGAYPYAPRAAQITSNVPWRLVAWLEAVPREVGSGRVLGSTFRVSSPPAALQDLAVGVRTVVARGEPTVSGAPRVVPLDVRLDTKGGERAGRYQASLHLAAEAESGP